MASVTVSEMDFGMINWNQDLGAAVGGVGLMTVAVAAVSLATPPPVEWLSQFECRISGTRCGHQETPECCTGNADCFYCPSGRQKVCEHTNNTSRECATLVADPPLRCNWYQQGQCWPDASCNAVDPDSTAIGKKCRDWINVIPLHCDRSDCVDRAVE